MKKKFGRQHLNFCKKILKKLNSLPEKEEYRSVVNKLKEKVALFTSLFSFKEKFKEKCHVAMFILANIPSSGENKTISEEKKCF